MIKISKISALLGSILTAVKTYLFLDKRISHDPQYLSDAFLSDVFPMLIIGVFTLLLPAIMLLFAGPFRNLVEKTSPIYPLLLAVGVWLANSMDDGLAYLIIMGVYILPATFVYALLVFIDGRIHRTTQRSPQKKT
jgi:hypothetical protein